MADLRATEALMEISEQVRSLAPDLTKTEPRSPHEKLGGESYAARALDKCRATLAGKNGEYQFGCPMDQHFFEETGIDQDEFRDFVATGASDEKVGEWITEQCRKAKR
jgi:hypothetical protein